MPTLELQARSAFSSSLSMHYRNDPFYFPPRPDVGSEDTNSGRQQPPPPPPHHQQQRPTADASSRHLHQQQPPFPPRHSQHQEQYSHYQHSSAGVPSTHRSLADHLLSTAASNRGTATHSFGPETRGYGGHASNGGSGSDDYDLPAALPPRPPSAHINTSSNSQQQHQRPASFFGQQQQQQQDFSDLPNHNNSSSMGQGQQPYNLLFTSSLDLPSNNPGSPRPHRDNSVGDTGSASRGGTREGGDDIGRGDWGDNGPGRVSMSESEMGYASVSPSFKTSSVGDSSPQSLATRVTSSNIDDDTSTHFDRKPINNSNNSLLSTSEPPRSPGSFKSASYDFDAQGRAAESSSSSSQQPQQQQPPAASRSSSVDVVYPCPVASCTKVFTRPQNLRAHAKSHCSLKPHKCTYCPLAFRRNHDLKRHMRLHNNERPYVCRACGKGFARSDALKRHVSSEISCTTVAGVVGPGSVDGRFLHPLHTAGLLPGGGSGGGPSSALSAVPKGVNMAMGALSAEGSYSPVHPSAMQQHHLHHHSPHHPHHLQGPPPPLPSLHHHFPPSSSMLGMYIGPTPSNMSPPLSHLQPPIHPLTNGQSHHRDPAMVPSHNGSQFRTGPFSHSPLIPSPQQPYPSQHQPHPHPHPQQQQQQQQSSSDYYANPEVYPSGFYPPLPPTSTSRDSPSSGGSSAYPSFWSAPYNPTSEP